MQRECRGLVFLINNEHFQNLPQRKGTQFDEENLKKLFTSLHFKVIVKKDLTAEVIKEFFSWNRIMILFLFYFDDYCGKCNWHP